MDKETFRALAGAYLGNGDSGVQWARHTGRSVLRLRISQPRDPDSNPYYPNSGILRRCIAALEEIVEASGPKLCQGPDRELLEKLYGGSGNPEELAAGPACGTSPTAVEAAAGDACRRHGVQIKTLSQSLGGLNNV